MHKDYQDFRSVFEANTMIEGASQSDKTVTGSTVSKKTHEQGRLTSGMEISAQEQRYTAVTRNMIDNSNSNDEGQIRQTLGSYRRTGKSNARSKQEVMEVIVANSLLDASND